MNFTFGAKHTIQYYTKNPQGGGRMDLYKYEKRTTEVNKLICRESGVRSSIWLTPFLKALMSQCTPPI